MEYPSRYLFLIIELRKEYVTFCGIICKAHRRTIFFLLFIFSFPIARNPRSTSCKSSHREECREQLLNQDLSPCDRYRTYRDGSTSRSREPRITFLVAHKSYYRRFISRNIADDYLRIGESARGVKSRRSV